MSSSSPPCPSPSPRPSPSPSSRPPSISLPPSPPPCPSPSPRPSPAVAPGIPVITVTNRGQNGVDTVVTFTWRSTNAVGNATISINPTATYTSINPLGINGSGSYRLANTSTTAEKPFTITVTTRSASGVTATNTITVLAYKRKVKGGSRKVKGGSRKKKRNTYVKYRNN